MFDGFFYPKLQNPTSNFFDESRLKEVLPHKLEEFKVQLLLLGYDKNFWKPHGPRYNADSLSVLYQPVTKATVTWYFDLGLFNEIEGIWPDRNYIPIKNKQ